MVNSTWEGLSAGQSPSETLQSIGGVGGALAGEAQRIYEGLSVQEQTIAKRIFTGLVQLGEGTRDTRRRALIEGLVASGETAQRVQQVLNRFATSGARLITLSQDTAEVTHEALFAHWQLLNQWLDSNREDIRFQRRLEDASTYWETNGYPAGNLWRRPDLDLLKRYHQHSRQDMTPLQLQFFQASGGPVSGVSCWLFQG